jgi:hypothetical protein
MGGSTSTENRFIVTGCSPRVRASNSETDPNFFTTSVLNDSFTGDRTPLEPIPLTVSLSSNSLFNRIFNISINGVNQQLNFTIQGSPFGSSVIIPGNVQNVFDIEINKGPPSSSTCDTNGLIESYIIRCIAFNSVSNFVLKGDVYTITIFIFQGAPNNPFNEVSMQVEITRTKSPNITII